ncbi:ferredoxin [Halomarina ordinaria]|uniref:Ferredoxin n=1 Tax=Halomarina ordinaria TaxID=3033939 RepID=A0ABD5UF43_9EURY|nr:ferredoxin [Halomarina sp. PSRA2]
MRVEFDRDTCIGMYQCVAEWDAFERNKSEGKADLADSEEREDGLFVREVPEDAAFDAKFAARVCPVDAITVYDDDGEQLVPSP